MHLTPWFRNEAGRRIVGPECCRVACAPLLGSRITTRKGARPLWAWPPPCWRAAGGSAKNRFNSKLEDSTRRFGVSAPLQKAMATPRPSARSLSATSVRSHEERVLPRAWKRRCGSQSLEGTLHTTVARNPPRRRSPAPRKVTGCARRGLSTSNRVRLEAWATEASRRPTPA